MLKVTADVFSGRENPQWLLEGNDAQAVLKELALNRGAVAELDSGFQGLGLRGLVIETLSDDASPEYALPAAFRIANGASLYESKGLEIAARLIQGMLKATALALGPDDPQKPNKALQKFLLEQLALSRGAVATAATAAPVEEAESRASAEAARQVCMIEVGQFNPGFWNDPRWVTRNNCYNYASNRRTDTFAQPGRASGSMYSAINCAQVGAAAVRDGARQYPNCAPNPEAPRWYMALVIAPGPGFIDYHWYRKSKEGFWGHKPGGTPARNLDNSGHLITNPQTCDRGPYKLFCGYFFAQKRMVVR